MKKLNNLGDTILEVLLCITVISFVLGGAFVTSNRSLNVSRQAEERGEAIKLAEGQLERIKSLGAVASSPIYTVASPFCIDSSNAIVGPPACNATFGGATYIVSAQRTGNIFTVLTRWDRAGGGGQDETKISYKLYPL